MLLKIILLFTLLNTSLNQEYCKESKKNGELIEECENKRSSIYSKKRYILYDVNPPEGFNLRRDVYIRVATFANYLAKNDKIYDWYIVLPPWGNLYHWRSSDVGSQKLLPWGLFFDLKSLQKYVNVIEMYEFMEDCCKGDKEIIIDKVFYLMNDEEMFKTGKFKDKNVISKCSKFQIPYKEAQSKRIFGYFWGYNNISAHSLDCIIFHGTTHGLEQNLRPQKYISIMFDHMEIPLHNEYGSVEFWKARRSMRYSSELYEEADYFRKIYLNSSNTVDNVQRPADWTLQKRKRDAIGGPYLAVHFRRQDFVTGHASSTPSVENAAVEITKYLKKLRLNTVFVASDADDKEYALLKNHLSNYIVLRYLPSVIKKKQFKDGGIAIIDQIICSHARFFIGTSESTFTFRIQEDREILGFPVDSTFNTLCGKDKCSKGSRWEIVWN